MIVYVDHSTVRDGKQDELKAAMTDLVEFVDANEPDILSYNVFFSEDGTQMAVVHTHADSASLAYHLEVAGPKFPQLASSSSSRPLTCMGGQVRNSSTSLRHQHWDMGVYRYTTTTTESIGSLSTNLSADPIHCS
ncbi:hypothetical protein [Halovalidus salilacus]|uniref:hypothetical protein n=1 Tax=Halovalidus salilacus TaxID=3075124 RepID=UPI00387DC05E